MSDTSRAPGCYHVFPSRAQGWIVAEWSGDIDREWRVIGSDRVWIGDRWLEKIDERRIEREAVDARLVAEMRAVLREHLVHRVDAWESTPSRDACPGIWECALCRQVIEGGLDVEESVHAPACLLARSATHSETSRLEEEAIVVAVKLWRARQLLSGAQGLSAKIAAEDILKVAEKHFDAAVGRLGALR